MTNQEIISSLFESYKFTDAMPDDIRRAIIRSKREVLVAILKKTGKYSIITGLLIYVVFLLKKSGLGVSAAKLYFISTAATIAVTGSAVVVTGVAGYTSFIKQPVITAEAPAVVPAETPAAIEETKPAVTPAVQYKAEITPFKSKPDIAAESAEASRALLNAIRAQSGNSAAAISTPGKELNTKLTVNGTLAMVGGKYYIGVKLVDSSNSEIITQVNRTADGKEGIDTAAREIAKEIAPYLK